MLPKRDIAQLGPRIKNLDRNAFHTLYMECFEPLQLYAMRYVYDWQEAEDIVQNAFFNLLLNIHKYDGSRDVFTYLFVLVKNNCLNYNRRLRIADTHRDKLVETLLFANIEDPDLDPDMRQRLNDVLEAMPEKQREVMLKHIVERKKISEIAREMGVAESTTNTHLKRAMKHMRENLKFIILGVGEMIFPIL